MYDAAANYRTVTRTSDAIPFCANPQLLVPINALIRRQLILATSHASMQWLLLSRLCGFPLSVLVILAVTFFCMHALVLLRAKRTAKWALQYDQVLEHERQRLKPPESKSFHQFCVLLAVAFTALLVGLARSFSAETLAASCALLGSILLHAWDLHSSLTSLTKWREPQVTCEFTEHQGEKLPIRACEYASQLTTKRDSWLHFGSPICLVRSIRFVIVLPGPETDFVKRINSIFSRNWVEEETQNVYRNCSKIWRKHLSHQFIFGGVFGSTEHTHVS